MEDRAEALFRAVASGIRAQWMRRAPQWPPLFEAVAAAPSCLAGLLKIRAAATDEDSTALYAEFEARLCQALGKPSVQWPGSFGAFASRPPRARESVRSLPRIAPEQALVLLGPLRQLDGPAADLYGAAVSASFGEGATWPVPDEVMLRLLTPYVPKAWQPRWRAGQGLEPPSPWKAAREDAAARALRHADAAESIPGGLLGPRGTAEIAFAYTTLTLAASLHAAQYGATDHAA